MKQAAHWQRGIYDGPEPTEINPDFPGHTETAVTCLVDGTSRRNLGHHLRKLGLDVPTYRTRFPGAPIMCHETSGKYSRRDITDNQRTARRQTMGRLNTDATFQSVRQSAVLEAWNSDEALPRRVAQSRRSKLQYENGISASIFKKYHRSKKFKEHSKEKSLKSRLPFQEFLNRARNIHGGFYEYIEESYDGMYKKVGIVCSFHGKFLQSAKNHVAGSACPRCHGKILKIETEWLDALGVPERQKRIFMGDGRKVVVDGYDPNTNTIYEFLGDYWHGNPDSFEHAVWNPTTKCTFGELHHRATIKIAKLRRLGYAVIVMWERDWRFRIREPVINAPSGI